MIVAPKIANARPMKRVFEWLRLKINFSMQNVNKGARVPKNVAFAIVVNFMDSKKRAKCIPNKIPAKYVRFRFSFLSEGCFFIKLINHKMRAPMPIRQKDMVTAGTFSRNLAIIGDVLTESMAMNSNIMILNFNLKFL